ncbi:MAG TPA: hypothetical protein VMF13_15585 [Luteitalea sp.]|nr:hypothetical protein [Luteitalea sp.]
MDSLITAAAHALAAGDPLGALNRVALRNDPPALALRGIAMAQLGDLPRARSLVRQASRAFGARESLARARCVVAEAEIALAARDLHWPVHRLAAARATLEERGDVRNAGHARSVEIRRLLLLGRIDEAAHALDEVAPTTLEPAARAVHELAIAGIAMRRIQTMPARVALERAAQVARLSGIPALVAEVARAAAGLDEPAARLMAGAHSRPLRLADVEAVLASGAFVIDACRHRIVRGGIVISLATRPVLFALARILGEAWPHDATREHLLTHAFGARHSDESHRARLRVEIGRLRALLRPLCTVSATSRGFSLTPRGAEAIVVLGRPVDEPNAALLALLADGEAWSSSALALALSTSQRSVQRGLEALAAAGKVHALGRGRARRWTMPPMPGFATSLLLPTLVAGR